MYVKSWARTQSESYTVSDMESCGLADWRHGLSFVPRLIIARWFYKQCLLPGPVEPKTVAGKRKSGLSEWRARKKNISLSFYQTTNVSGSAASISCVPTIWFIYLTRTQWWKPGLFFSRNGWNWNWNRNKIWRLSTEEQLYQVLIGQESASALLHGAGRPPLSRDVPTLIRQNLRKGWPAVVWLVERAVRPAWCPVGRLPGDGVVSKCCLQTHTHTHTVNSTVSVVDVSVKCCGVCCE